jgi:hypothetical protein
MNRSQTPVVSILAFLTFQFLVPSAALHAQTPGVDTGLLATATASAREFLHQRFHKCGPGKGADYFVSAT